MRQQRFNTRSLLSCLICFGTFLFLFGLIFGLAVRAKINQTLLDNNSVCGFDSDNFDDWRTNTDSDDPPKYKLYFAFNATNAAAYLGQLPGQPVSLQLDMRGPYAMRQFDTYYNISFAAGDSQVTYKTFSRYDFDRSQSCDACDSREYYTNFNPALLNLMGAIGSEALVGLTVSNFDLAYGAVPACNETNIAHSMAGVCDVTTDGRCCCNSTKDPGNAMSCLRRAAGLYSTFAAFDGGVSFPSPSLGRQAVSAVLITKNTHEAAYGYPSALLGLLLPKLKGTPRYMAGVARFTQLMLLACNFSSEGMSPSPYAMPNKEYQYLGLTTCAPIAASRYWAEPWGPLQQPRCEYVNAALNASDACLCVVPAYGEGGRTTETRPCCTRKGLGCLVKVPGYVSDDLFFTEDAAYANSDKDNTTQNTGCGNYPEGQDFWWSRYEGVPAIPVWAQQGRAPNQPPSPSDVQAVAKDPSLISFWSPVMGDDGTRYPPAGVTSGLLSPQLSAGSVPSHRTVYVTQVVRALTIPLQGTEDWRGIRVARYSPRPDFLANASLADPAGLPNYMVGAATPLDGVQDATYVYGVPTYVSRPLFLYGDKTLLTRGIKVTIDGEEAEATPEQFETYLLMEPASGMTICGHKRLQASFALYTCTAREQGCEVGMGFASLLSPFVPGGVIVPQYYMDETSEATDDQVSKLKKVLRLNHSAGALVIVAPLLGGLITTCSCVLLYRAIKFGKRSSIDTASLMSDKA